LVILNKETEKVVSSSGCAVITKIFGPCAAVIKLQIEKNKKSASLFIMNYLMIPFMGLH
jgi:hypothetical protein